MKALISFLLAGFPVLVCANPNGLTVQSGSASLSSSGSQLTVSVSQNAFLNWNSFNIGAGETTRFQQPSASSIVWNQVTDPHPSQIYGNLEANGLVVLMNQAGFYFGPNSFVNAAGLVVSTAPMTPLESSGGLFWQFNGAPPEARIINYGQLQVERGGSLFLIGEHIENHGTLQASEGNIGLLAGQEVLLGTRPDGRSLSSSVRLPSGSVDNSGRVVADAGTIALQARVVNQDGLIQANSVREQNGVIELVASDAIRLGENSRLSADGSSAGAGGKIRIQSDRELQDTATSRITVAGGRQGGDAGSVEISALEMRAIRSQIDARAYAGGIGGQLRIDPTDIVIGTSPGGSAGGGTIGVGEPPTTLTLDVNASFLGFSRIELQASRNITLSGGTLWDLLASTGKSEPGSLLKLEAGNDIVVGNGAGIVAGDQWSISLQAGRDFSSTESVLPGVGNISLLGTGYLQTQSGDITLRAGNNVTVAGGFVRTMAGGDIEVQALSGNINTGTKQNGFFFRPNGYSVDPDLGGISTANGGNVTLQAGQDITSLLPLSTSGLSDGGSGAFGEAPGNVTISARRDVVGHYVVRHGTGSITAGRNAGTSARLLALSLVDGGWSVEAGQDILLQEVRNPNGIFNNLGSANSKTKHFFDYALDAYTRLHAGNSVQLRGTALPRSSDVFEQGIPPIYPGTLEITAGAGGVRLGNDVNLFPSPLGQLRVLTTDGGSLVGTKPGDLVQFIVSDSGKYQYRAFGDFGLADHAATPVHLNDSEPARIDVAGDMSGILLGVPKRAEVTVQGNMVNSRFDGQNLHPNDVTRIHVGGNIINRNEFTSVIVEAVPEWATFELAYPPLSGNLAGLPSQFAYDPASHTLTFRGRMTGDQLQALLNLPVRTFDPNGFPILNSNGEPATRPVQVLSPAVANQLYALSQDIPQNSDTGYRIGGGGKFEITAHNVDLGATAGIVSQGPRANSALANYFTRGADVAVTVGGDLEMFSTKIASLSGGDIQVVAEGNVNVGSRAFSSSDAAARGIFTVDPSAVTVIARGDININGSRIAAYDGGNVTVRSLEGNIDAGTGTSGAATVEKIVVDPVTHEMLSYAPTIPGSGILATTFPPSLDAAFPASLHPVGDILVETPRGDIIASAGGVVQIPLNGVGTSAGTVTLRAGSKGVDGNVLYEGNIDATGSGVIGSTVSLEASGNITGLVFARQNIELSAQQSVNVTALAQGGVTVSAGGNVSGTIIGVGSVNASGSTVDAALLSQNISTSGDVSGSQVGFAQANAAGATSQSLQNEDQSKASVADSASEEEKERRRNQTKPRLAKSTGRVTIISPKLQ